MCHQLCLNLFGLIVASVLGDNMHPNQVLPWHCTNGVHKATLYCPDQSQSFPCATSEFLLVGQPVIYPYKQVGSDKVVHTADFELSRLCRPDTSKDKEGKK